MTARLRPERHRLRRSTFWTLLIGYGGYYLCRANLGVAAPLLQSELHLDKVQIGAIAGISTLLYAAGKLTNGPVSDILGGKAAFLLGMAGAVLANAAFGFASGLSTFVLIWSLNRFVQSAGWMGLVQLVSRWYERSEYGVIMGWLSLSFLVGDVAAKGYGAAILRAGLGWRALFLIPAATVAALLAVASFTLHSGIEASARLATASKETKLGARLGGILLRLARSRGFWMSCALSFLLTLLRTVFLDWTALFLVESGAAPWKAALEAAIFPLTGALGTLFAGWYSDRVSGGRRGPVMALMLGLLVAALGLLALHGAASPIVAIACIGAAGFFLLGPYSLLAGALALDYGGQEASATASGITDGVGYLGGSASGLLLGGVIQSYGWTAAFLCLAGCAAISLAVSLVFLLGAEPTPMQANSEPLPPTPSSTSGGEGA